ncbi:uncharacterized protein [Choristoneura fumiferana]|uniref:uncharacterized protein n=1 Tax=Choristoneura fumiferana TaxID=7141 RepID=UPI003D153F22
MESNIDCNLAEKDDCICKSGATLAILKDVQRAYEERMDVIERVGGKNKLQMQVCVLRSWVGDLVAQNSLLARAVEDLEQETTTRLALERRRHAERDSSHERKSKMIELRINNETLRKENYAKDREIRRLNKDIQQYELTLTNLRTEMTQGQGTCSPPEVIKKDAEVMAGMCCTGTECGDLEPVKDVGELLREETNKYRERIHKMELSLKSSGVKVRAVHKINLGLIEELGTLRRLCVAVDLERRDARLRLDLEGQIVKQMLKQLQQAKAKLQQKEMESSRSDFVSGDHEYRQPSHASMPVAKTRARRDQPALDCDPDFRGPEFEGNGDGMLSRQSD